MNPLHHLPKQLGIFDVTDCVIVVVYKRDDPGDELILAGPMVEPVEEDRFGFFSGERRIAVAASSGDEVDGVVAIPVLEAVTAVVAAPPTVYLPTLNSNESVVAAVTPQQYGAVADGVSDDTAAFQAAINAAYDQGHRAGGGGCPGGRRSPGGHGGPGRGGTALVGE